MPTIVELANQAGQLTRAMSARADLNLHSPMFLGLASGFDVAITLMVFMCKQNPKKFSVLG